MKRTRLIAVLIVAIAVNIIPTMAYALNQNEVTCFQNFQADMIDCSNLGTWWQRSICGADAELELAFCVGSAIAPWRK